MNGREKTAEKMKAAGSFRLPRTAYLALIPALFLSGGAAFGLDGGMPGPHRGAVTALATDGERIISAGEDGFLELWNIRDGGAEERFQIGFIPIMTMAKQPGKTRVCVLESDGFTLYRISVWDYREKIRLFFLDFGDPVSCLGYSAGGRFIIIAHSGRAGLLLADSETGESVPLSGIPGTPVFAATGPSERSMVTYFGNGRLSYQDLGTGDEREALAAPPRLSSLVLFGGNRFLAGLDGESLVILDAVSAEILEKREAKGAFLSACPGGEEAYSLAPVPQGGNGEERIYELSGWKSGGTGRKRGTPIPQKRVGLKGESVTSFLSTEEGIFFGTDGGKTGVIGENGRTRIFASGERKRIIEAEVSGETLAVITEDGRLGFLPSDFSRFGGPSGGSFSPSLRPCPGYTRISGGGGEFVLWQTAARTPPPVLVREGFPDRAIEEADFRFPLRSVSALDEKLLFLDAAGNTAVIDARTGKRIFSFSAAGAIDAAFVDGENIILGRSAVSGNGAFLAVNIVNGETVPLYLSARTGVRVYRSSGGAVYGAVIEENPRKTVIVSLEARAQGKQERLFEYDGEDILFALAESGGEPALNPGGGEAFLPGKEGPLFLERGQGLPVKLLDGGSFFITLDGEGSLSWQDNVTGKLLALFSLTDGGWTLAETEGASRGKISRDSDSSEPSQ
ncbi:MAG: WD40 repeat domain-containing protein [Treponema sp.]|jgi:hypothetical protein|nr:WD40 repeat domain-containing protein [Treponema sp.]